MRFLNIAFLLFLSASSSADQLRLSDIAEIANSEVKEAIFAISQDLSRRNINPKKFYAAVREVEANIVVELTDEKDLDNMVPGGGKGDSQVCKYNKQSKKVESCLYYQ